MIAVVPARAGEPCRGGVETAAEAKGRFLVVGSGASAAAGELAAALAGKFPGYLSGGPSSGGQSSGGQSSGASQGIEHAMELGAFRPGLWAKLIAPSIRSEPCVILPASPDGRDLAPRLAAELRRPLLAVASAVDEQGATLVRHGGSQSVRVAAETPFVATLLASMPGGPASAMRTADDGAPHDAPGLDEAISAVADAETLAILEADAGSMDLGESPRILAGGAGLGGSKQFSLLDKVASLLGASVGGTRVATDAGLVSHERQIGTTGVAVSPRLYVALGISGAAQHLGGVAADRVIAVNLDPSCPMMLMADLALVSDAAGVLTALAELLDESAASAGSTESVGSARRAAGDA